MTVKLHLLGGSGRIGRALVDSLVDQPLANVSAVQIYCDATKVADIQAHYSTSTSPRVRPVDIQLSTRSRHQTSLI